MTEKIFGKDFYKVANAIQMKDASKCCFWLVGALFCASKAIKKYGDVAIVAGAIATGKLIDS